MYDSELILILSLHIEVIGICCLRFIFHLYVLTPTDSYKFFYFEPANLWKRQFCTVFLTVC